MTNEKFLPDDYEPPKGESRYMKFTEGANKFRVLSTPIIGWEDWKDKKPHRYTINNKPEKPFGKNPIKHFWAFVVWNYQTEAINILEITQMGIMNTIRALSRSENWGSPFGYDIVVERKGKDLETEYTVTPDPPSEIDDIIKKSYRDMKINLDALFSGDDPFGETTTVTEDNDNLPF